jgi:hypothetical protein
MENILAQFEYILIHGCYEEAGEFLYENELETKYDLFELEKIFPNHKIALGHIMFYLHAKYAD